MPRDPKLQAAMDANPALADMVNRLEKADVYTKLRKATTIALAAAIREKRLPPGTEVNFVNTAIELIQLNMIVKFCETLLTEPGLEIGNESRGLIASAYEAHRKLLISIQRRFGNLLSLYE